MSPSIRTGLPGILIPDTKRVMPETRPDEDFLDHKLICNCGRCKSPAVLELQKKRRRAEVNAMHPSRVKASETSPQ